MILFFGTNDSLAETNEPNHKLSHNRSIKEPGEFGFSLLYRERTVNLSNDSFITHTILDNTHTDRREWEARPYRDKVYNEKQFSPEIKNRLLKKQVHSQELSKRVGGCHIDFLRRGLPIPSLIPYLMFTTILYYTNKNYLYKYEGNTHVCSIEYEILWM